jgi:SAM-dependent methyltransferase
MDNQIVSAKIGESAFYDEIYRRDNYFLYWRCLYEPYVSSLINFCALEKGSSVLDIGCGQGFFSYLFNLQGMKVCGIDISETGIRKAETLYGHFGISFAVSDIRTAPVSKQFDCLFTRSCSLYNRADFTTRTELTANMLRHLKPNGTLIFAYNSNFSSKPSPKWRFHSLAETRKHFCIYGEPLIFVQNKISTFLLRKYSLSRPVTLANILFSKITGAGGEIVCIVKEPRLALASGANNFAQPSEM